MRRAFGRLAGLAAGLALVIGAGAVPAAGSPPAVRWEPCPQDPVAQCGTVAVPVDWARPGGPRIDLALVRLPATDPAARIGALVDVPGGPGDSGVDRVLSNRGRFIASLNRRFDIVGYDARGIGRSHPVVCSADLLAAEPPPVPANQAEFEARVAFNRRLRADCRARTGPLFDHVDTLSGVRDLDAVRAALGERTLTFRGRSYGTLLGQQYAERYPHRIRAMVLDSVTDHSLGTRANIVTQAANVQDSFDEFAAWCARTAGCALHGRDVRAVWADLLARADDPFFLVDLAEQGLRGPWWAELAQVLADQAGGAARPAVADAGEVPYPQVAIFCADYDLPVRDHAELAVHLRRAAEVAPDMRYGTFGVYGTVVCLGAPKPVANPQHRLDVRGVATPLLLVNARHDPATGHAWAANVARQLGGAGVLLTYEGWGHIVYGRGACVDEAVDRYLFTRVPPAPGTTCPPAGG